MKKLIILASIIVSFTTQAEIPEHLVKRANNGWAKMAGTQVNENTVLSSLVMTSFGDRTTVNYTMYTHGQFMEQSKAVFTNHQMKLAPTICAKLSGMKEYMESGDVMMIKTVMFDIDSDRLEYSYSCGEAL